MKRIVIAAGLLAAACAHAPPRAPDRALADWHGKFPLAAQELCLTESSSPILARRLQKWERDNPVMAQDLLEWGAMHPGEPLPAFLRDHPSYRADAWFWGDAGAGLLLGWAWRHPEAALALADDPDLLSWSASHRIC